jgi:hypothetical protein
VLLNQSGSQPQVFDGLRLIVQPAITSELLSRFSGKALVVEQSLADADQRLGIDAPVVTNKPSAPGESVLARFRIINCGTDTLDGISVSAGCGVAVACDAQVLEPGERGTIVARHAQPAVGRYSYVVRLTTNDPYRRVAQLCLTGSVVPDGVVVAPIHLAIPSQPTGREVARHFRVVGPSGLDLEARWDGPEWIDVGLVKGKDDGVAATWVGTVCVTQSAESGDVEGEVRIVDGATKEAQRAVTVKLEVQGNLCASPARVFFGFVRRADGPVTRLLRLSARSGTAVVIERVEVSGELIRCEKADGGAYDISVSPDRVGVVSGTVRFTAQGEHPETLDVPVYAHVVE